MGIVFQAADSVWNVWNCYCQHDAFIAFDAFDEVGIASTGLEVIALYALLLGVLFRSGESSIMHLLELPGMSQHIYVFWWCLVLSCLALAVGFIWLVGRMLHTLIAFACLLLFSIVIHFALNFP